MTKQQLERLLDKACEIIDYLEEYASEELQNEINAFYSEIIHSDELDADMEAQDYDVFGKYKI
jgi:hypothetical protein